MRILAIYKYYWPDTTAYARLLKAILERWARAGHQVTVLTAQPGYNDIRHPRQPASETVGGVEVRRLWTVREVKRSFVRRAASLLIFLARSVMLAGRRPRADLIIVNANPAVLMGVTVRLIRRLFGIPFLYHCQDIHPESAHLTGQVRSGPLYRFLLRLDRTTCRRAGLIVTLSRDMQTTLAARGIEKGKIEIINNFILDDDEAPATTHSVLRETLGDDRGDFVLLFAGNLGRFQGLEHFVETARRLRGEPGIQFVFMGEGVAKQATMTAAGEMLDRTVFFSSYQPLPLASRAMGEADLTLISLGRGVHRVAYPSKTMMYLAAGSPILAIVERQSGLANEILEHELGYCCEQGDYDGTVQAILDARDRRESWRRRRAAIAEYARQVYAAETVLQRWDGIPERVVDGPGRAG